MVPTVYHHEAGDVRGSTGNTGNTVGRYRPYRSGRTADRRQIGKWPPSDYSPQVGSGPAIRRRADAPASGAGRCRRPSRANRVRVARPATCGKTACFRQLAPEPLLLQCDGPRPAGRTEHARAAADAVETRYAAELAPPGTRVRLPTSAKPATPRTASRRASGAGGTERLPRPLHAERLPAHGGRRARAARRCASGTAGTGRRSATTAPRGWRDSERSRRAKPRLSVALALQATCGNLRCARPDACASRRAAGNWRLNLYYSNAAGPACGTCGAHAGGCRCRRNLPRRRSGYPSRS